MSTGLVLAIAITPCVFSVASAVLAVVNYRRMNR